MGWFSITTDFVRFAKSDHDRIARFTYWGTFGRIPHLGTDSSSFFFWVGMSKDVKDFIRRVCQQIKVPTTKLSGLLQRPLAILSAIWEDQGMDFVTGLPTVGGKSVIVVVVDRLTKYCHLGALPAGYTAISVADYFINQIVRLHGLPKTITSDRDKIFMSRFWKEFFTRSGTTLNMSSTYHPETDNQTEITNEQYLRATVHQNPRSWSEVLPWAELWHNSSYYHSLKTTPFQAVYGRSFPEIINYRQGDSMVEAVDVALTERKRMLAKLQHNLHSAQERMKKYADLRRRPYEFNEGDWV